MYSYSNLLVTIAIPVYNAERYLCDAIQSVINQTYSDWCLYLINDGSTDNSVSIMQEFAAKDSRIKIIDDGKNKGLPARLNESIALTKTKYYARMDADDIMYITRIEEQVRYLEEHPGIDVLGTSIMTIDNNNTIIGSGLCYGSVNSFIHPTVMGKTEWFKTNLYCEWAVRAQDAELWYRTSYKSHFWSLDRPLLFYREFGIPTLNKYLKSKMTILRILSYYKKYHKSICWFLLSTFKTLLKMGVYIYFALLGKIDMLVKWRNRKPIPKHLCLTQKDLELSIRKPN